MGPNQMRVRRPSGARSDRDYGRHGAVFVPQPEDIWTHQQAEVVQVRDREWLIVLPLWTTDESPSDLSAEITVSAAGNVSLDGVHVL